MFLHFNVYVYFMRIKFYLCHGFFFFLFLPTLPFMFQGAVDKFSRLNHPVNVEFGPNRCEETSITCILLCQYLNSRF